MDKVVIIAEAGVNHNGKIDLAKEMIEKAKKAGADYVKFQTFIPENMVSKYAAKAEYQKKATDAAESQLEMIRRLTLTFDEFIKLKKYSDELGIGFISTPFDIDSIYFLETLDMDFWKIPSGEITNLPYLEVIARTERKVVLSTGMSSLNEIQAAVEILEKNGTKDIILLHCTTQYPAPYEDVNLRAMNQINETIKKKVGYSDHTMGIEIPIAAAALGAVIIEKHFTLDRNMEGPDHKASLEPEELKKMIDAIRNLELAMGNGEKAVAFSEKQNKAVARKSIVAKINIQKGDLYSEDNLTIKRPGTGISPMKWYEVLGKSANRDYLKDEMIEV